MKLARVAAGALVLAFCISAFAAAPQTPSQFLGFEVGADRKLADYKQIAGYFKALAAASPRVEIESLGPTTLANDMIMAVISSEENLKNKKKYQEIARKLSDPRGMSGEQVEALVKEGKAIVLVTCNIHASEIGSTQMAMEWAYALATAQDAATRQRLNNVILLLVPSLNPDGQIMEVEWYRKNLGTKYEGSRLPYLYHHYAGHDNNRDWYMLTQKESINVTRAVYQEWFPQVWLDEHQMGQTGPRIFMPPYSDPVAKNIHPLVFRGVNVIGSNMALRLEEQKKSGVIYGAMFDAYWPGGTKNTAWFKNIVGLLTEVASVKLATPVTVAPTELSGGSKGLVEYTQTTNYLNPWPGGVWRLRDIMDYERIASDALLEVCANYREDFLKNKASMSMDVVNSFQANEYYRIPMQQRDPLTAAKLAHLMRDHGVDVMVQESTRDFYIPLAQPYGKFVSEMLGVQRYPRVKAVAGQNIIAPYDVAAWSLPLMMDVKVEKTTISDPKGLRRLTDTDYPQGRVRGNGNLYAVARDANNATRLVNAALKQSTKNKAWVAKESFVAGGTHFAAGTILLETEDAAGLASKYRLELTALSAKPDVPTAALHPVRVGMYKPWLASMDEGWTRFILEQYEFELKPLDNKALKAGNLKSAFDAIILPDMSKDVILEGRWQGRGETAMKYVPDYPAEYTGGIGKEGVKALKDFVEQGGTLISLAHAGELLADEFNLPVRNALAGVKSDEFSCPGSILRINVDPHHPVTWGMPEEAAAFVDDGIAYQTAIPGSELDRYVLAWYPSDAEDILLSGWIRGAERLQRRAAVVAFTSGKGKVVMLGFRAQFRAQTEGTYKLLFNSLLWAGMEEPTPGTGTKAAAE
jgi:hypothetical protein